MARLSAVLERWSRCCMVHSLQFLFEGAVDADSVGAGDEAIAYLIHGKIVIYVIWVITVEWRNIIRFR